MARPDPHVLTELDCYALAVKGEPPAELDGVLIRIGPDGRGSAGQPHVGALRIRHGHAEWYRARRVRTDAVCRQTGELPSPGPRRCASDNTDAAVIRHGRQILALGEGVLPYELTADLRTKARCDFDDTLPSGFSSRPIHDSLTGELFAAVADPCRESLRYMAVDVKGHVRKYETVPVTDDPSQYAFALTERHALFLGPTEIGFMPREGGPEDVRWIDAVNAPLGGCDGGNTKPATADQPVNAFELRDGTIAVDVMHDDGHDSPALWRRVVDPSRGTVHDPLYQGTNHRYVVTRLLTGAERNSTALVLHDLAEGTSRLHHADLDRDLGA